MNYYDLKCPYCQQTNDFMIVRHTFSGIEGETSDKATASYEVKDVSILKCVKCDSFISIIPKGEVETTKE